MSAVWWSASPAFAVPARPGPIQVEQPDGTGITVYLRGDERAHWYEDADGRLVTRSPQSGEWVYAIEVDGAIQPTALVVGRDTPQGVEPFKRDAQRIRQAAKVRRQAKAPRPAGPARAPLQGTMRNLVIPVNFTDLTIAHTQQEFTNLFNQTPYSTGGATGSVKEYYDEVSYQALTIESTVVATITLDQDYGYYGLNDAWGEDLRPATMVRDALVKLEARGFDFSQMDGDGDGYVDGLTVVHAGQGEENGTDPNAIWSHKWQLGNPLSYDGVILEPYVTVPAIRDVGGGLIRIGVICHELGHHLGLPDLYDTDNSSAGAGNFCLMAGGAWNGGDGKTPAHMSAWCKVALDWVSPTVIATAGTYTASQAAFNAQVFKLQGSFEAHEYFLVENRPGVGFDALLPGSQRGILIWHIDDNQVDNDDETHYKVDLEEPNGTQHLETNTSGGGDDDDYWRQTGSAEFSNTTNPSTDSYDSTPLGFAIQNIGVTGTNMTFSIVMVNPQSISGYIRTADGVGIESVTVTEDRDSGWDITDTDGYYRLPVRLGWSGTVTPTRAGYTFGPASRAYDNVRQSLSGQNYTAVEGGVDPNDPNSGDTGTLSVQTLDEFGQALSGGIYVNAVFKDSGSWSGLASAGQHTVSFGTLGGYTTPGAEVVTVAKDQTTSVTGTYATSTGGSTLTVAAVAEPNYVNRGESALVSATASGGRAPYTYLWDTGHNKASFIAAPKWTSTFTVTAKDSLNVTGTASVTLILIGTPLTVTVQADPETVSEGGSSTVTAAAAGGVVPYTYSWNTGETDSTIAVSPNEPTDYTATVTDLLGTTATATVKVNTPQVAGVVVPGGTGGAPCLAPAAILGVLLVAVGCGTVNPRGSRRRARRRTA